MEIGDSSRDDFYSGNVGIRTIGTRLCKHPVSQSVSAVHSLWLYEKYSS
jgi:hypothetical protein